MRAPGHRPEGGDGKAGRCVDGEQKAVTIVNGGDDLELEEATISDVEVSTGTALRTNRFGTSDTERAMGRYVVVGYKLLNTGNLPITSVRPGLVIGGKHFTEDTRASLDLRAREIFPLQPGASGRTTAAFDLPDASAGDYDGGRGVPGRPERDRDLDRALGLGRARAPRGRRAKGPRRFAGTRLSR